MTGIWLASKRDRYRAFLAGSLVDATSASLFVGLLWAHQRAGLGFSPLELEVLSACLLIYLLRILWQCFFFVRTDFYFVVTTAFNCKSLLDDTTNYLRNRSSALLGLSRPVVDQSHIPSGEMRVIRWYSLVWLAGRVIAFASLLFITFPILWRYVRGIAPMLVGDRSTYGVLDAVIFGVLGIGLAGTGMTMWVRSIFQKVRERKSDAVARAALQHR